MRLGIVGAMDSELAHLKGKLADVQVSRWTNMDFFAGTLGRTCAVIVRCGVGKVNAALCVQALADHFAVTHVINTGVAGSLDGAIDIADIVVSTDAVQHDMDVTSLGYAPGQIPDLDVLAFPADPALRALALAAVKVAAPGVRAFEGRIASGDQFVHSPNQRERIASLFKASCAEMEGAAFAQACYLNSLPFVIIRAISDKADGSSNIDYPSFEKTAAERCARIVEQMAVLLGNAAHRRRDG